MSKKRILWVAEGSFLSTGFSTYTMEILRYLHSTGKYQLSEIGCYCRPDDPRQQSVPWKFYGTAPTNPQEEQIVHSKSTNQFGEWKFDEICLDFQPQIVIDCRDAWMVEFISRSPYRKMFKWIYMTCVDSTPTQTVWLPVIKNADLITGYTEWGTEVAYQQSGKTVQRMDYVGAGPNTNIFKPVENKYQHKINCGLDPDSLIIMTVMRNQKRKLFPELISAFYDLLESLPPHLKDKTYLYLHTSVVDVGFNFPELLQRYPIANKVLFTYSCKNCGLIFPSFFKDAITFCPRCKSYSASAPNTGNGIPQEALPSIYNLADLYIQYSVCEGLGIPAIEAASCEVPIMGGDYSATSEVLEKCCGFKVPIAKFYHESETGCIRSYPDNRYLIDAITKFFALPPYERKTIGKMAREGVLKYFSIERASKIWEKALDELEVYGDKDSWKLPTSIFQPHAPITQNITNGDFIRYGIAQIWGRSEMIHSALARQLIKALNYGFFTEGTDRGKPFNRESAIQLFLSLNNQWNQAEINRGKKLLGNSQKTLEWALV